MTASTATTLRVPVRTWREKAILAASISSKLPSIEGIESPVSWVDELLLGGEGETDRQIDAACGAWRYVEETLATLRALRSIEPGADAGLEVSAVILEWLSDQIDYMAETDSDSMTNEHISRREWANTLIIAIDLRDELVGGEV